MLSESERTRVLPGGGVIEDWRTPEQKAATIAMVVATDRFMSGWGKAQGRSYFAVPVTDPDHLHIVLENMEDRDEMLRVRVVGNDYRPRLRDGDHLSIREPAAGRWLVKGAFCHCNA